MPNGNIINCYSLPGSTLEFSNYSLEQYVAYTYICLFLYVLYFDVSNNFIV